MKQVGSVRGRRQAFMAVLDWPEARRERREAVRHLYVHCLRARDLPDTET